MPSEDYVTDKVNDLTSEFGFAGSIVETAQEITDALGTTTYANDPPIIYMDLGSAEGNYNYGGKVVALDLSWFARYKPTTDALISGLLWVTFVWRVYCLLPGIINGASGTPGQIEDVQRGYKIKKGR